MIARTNLSGVTKITVTSRKKELQVLFEKMLEDATLRERFTKTHIQTKFSLTQPEAVQFLQFAEQKERLFRHDKTGQKWEEAAFAITEPAPPKTMMNVTPWWRQDMNRFNGSHQCTRCHQWIGGRGRHNKSARGHTKEICDIAMVEMLHQL